WRAGASISSTCSPAISTVPAAPCSRAPPRRSAQSPKASRSASDAGSRVSGQPEVGGLIPSSTMAEEMLTPGDGQVRAMILLMTNPVRSAANSEQLEAAFSGLDFLVAVDFYINETTRHADLILPTPSPAEQPNYEFGLYHLSVRNVTKWSSAAIEPPAGSQDSWQVLLNLGATLMGMDWHSAQQVDDL